MTFSRRDMLKQSLAAAAACTVAGKLLAAEAAPAGRKIPIGLQLYSVRKQCAKDLPGVIAAVAKMGYQAVEFAGYYNRKAAELRKMLDDNGLACCGSHLQLKALQGDTLKETVEFNRTLGNPYLIVASLPHDKMASIQALTDTAQFFTETAAKVKDQGLHVGYHAHPGDFKPVEGQIPWEVFFSHAGPDVVMQLDIGNCMVGGGDPVAELKKFPGRTATIHLKEFGGPKGAVIGEGTMPWPEILNLCQTVGNTQWYLIEHESPVDDPLKAVKSCLDNLRKMTG